jgi:glycine cleavage system aminomethyltransferase T
MFVLTPSPLHFDIFKENPRAKWVDFHGMPVALRLDDPAEETQFAQTVALADASFLSRIVLKGPGAEPYLQSLGVPIPQGILKVAPLENGGLIARTGGSEFFLESGIVGWPSQAAADGLGSPSYKDGVYPVLRQDASLIISGSRAGELFRHVSSYDFITEPHHDLVFTPIAGVSCSVLRQTMNGFPAFRLWTDGTYGLYIWHTLLGVAKELGGGAVGTAVFFPGLSSEAKQP